ncbi:MAG: hypothetical protein P8L23_01770 [Flavobacteriales bacterium]|nr:hypothetical protein [Flavobacteriales bacterium]
MNFKSYLPYITAVLAFIIISIVYFNPAVNGYSVSQHDIQQHKGMSKEIKDHRETYGEEPLWTNSMFGGMPATQISVIYNSNLIGKIHKIIQLGLPQHVNYLFLYFIGFFILLLCFKVDPFLAFVGAIAFGFSSYFFIIIDAGHNTKAIAIAYMSPVIGGLVLAYGNRLYLGAAIMTFFLSLQINANHPQVTYYLFILLFFIVIQQFVSYYKQKEIKKFFKKSCLLLIGVLLGISTNIPNLYGTYEYSPYTQRGGSELSVGKDDAGQTKSSMSKDYALQWSYGKQESLSFLIPNIKGGSSGALIASDAIQKDKTNKYQELKEILQLNYQFYQNRTTSIISDYFGNQASTSGPVYMGAIVCFLFILGLIFVKNPIKWPLLIMAILSLLLSWGKNFPVLTDFFWEYLPAYNKFRAVTIILVMVELVFPLLALLWLKEVFQEKDYFSKYSKLFFSKKEYLRSKIMLWTSSVFVGFLFLIILLPSSFTTLISEKEQPIFEDPTYLQQQLSYVIKNNPEAYPDQQNFINQQLMVLQPKLKKAEAQLIALRSDVIRKDTLRSLVFVLLFITLLYLFSKNKITKKIFIGLIGLLLISDLWLVDQRYLNNEKDSKGNYQHWIEKDLKAIPYTPTYADLAVLNNETKTNPTIGNSINQEFNEFRKEKDKVSPRENYSFRFGKLNQKTNYRVLLLSGGFQQETSISYFHKSLGGYNSTKIQRYQDLLEHKFNKQMQLASNPNTLVNASLINMLNTKYIITNPNGNGRFIDMNDPSTFTPENQKAMPGFINPHAMGNAWFVNEVKAFSSPDVEFSELDNFDENNTATTDTTFGLNSSISKNYAKNESASILMTSYKPNKITYALKDINGGEHFVVFSEVFYPLGWKAYVDGIPTDISRVNYFLRGVKVPEGTTSIELVYNLKSFNTLSTIALASSSLIILLVIGCFYLSLFKLKDF